MLKILPKVIVKQALIYFKVVLIEVFLVQILSLDAFLGWHLSSGLSRKHGKWFSNFLKVFSEFLKFLG